MHYARSYCYYPLQLADSPEAYVYTPRRENSCRLYDQREDIEKLMRSPMNWLELRDLACEGRIQFVCIFRLLFR